MVSIIAFEAVPAQESIASPKGVRDLREAEGVIASTRPPLRSAIASLHERKRASAPALRI